MIDFTSEAVWNENFKDKHVKQKMSFENRIVSIGLVLFGTCITINTILIYIFVRLLNKM